ncbi:MAG: aldo/keto reductase [Calditrichia bacterium]
MKYRTFGRLDWKVSEIGFGAWAIGGDAWGEQKDEVSLAALHRALDLGVNFIDTAQVYGNGHSERLIGKVLRERKEKVGDGKIKVATKIPPKPGNWPPFPHESCEVRFPEDYLRERVEFSLKNLKAEVLDLVQLHTWTRAWNRNPSAVHVLQQLKKEGKILAVGISTPEHDQNSLIELMRNGLLDSVQVIYNIFEQEPAAEFLPAALENNSWHSSSILVRISLSMNSVERVRRNPEKGLKISSSRPSPEPSALPPSFGSIGQQHTTHSTACSGSSAWHFGHFISATS